MLFVLDVIVAVWQIMAHHLVKVRVLMLRVWAVEVIVLVLSLLLLCVKYLCEFPEIGLELFFVFMVY